jgi:hypothetical protein
MPPATAATPQLDPTTAALLTRIKSESAAK